MFCLLLPFRRRCCFVCSGCSVVVSQEEMHWNWQTCSQASTRPAPLFLRRSPFVSYSSKAWSNSFSPTDWIPIEFSCWQRFHIPPVPLIHWESSTSTATDSAIAGLPIGLLQLIDGIPPGFQDNIESIDPISSQLSAIDCSPQNGILLATIWIRPTISILVWRLNDCNHPFSIRFGSDLYHLQFSCRFSSRSVIKHCVCVCVCVCVCGCEWVCVTGYNNNNNGTLHQPAEFTV